MRQTQRGVLEFGSILLAAYTSLAVGIAEATPFPYVLTFPVAVAALLLWRYRPSLQLRPAAAFILGLLAFALAFTELMTGSIEARLTAGAHLLAYLTWILLIMRKQLVEHLWLLAMCVVQVALGSVLSARVSYGFLVMVFLLLALWNLAVFSMVRAQRRFLDEDDQPEEETQPAKTTAAGVVGPPAAHPSGVAGVSLLQPSTASGAIHIDANERWLSKRFVTGVLGLAFAAAFFGFAFFLVIPRFWIGGRTWGVDDTSDDGGVTGFSENVSLGAFGTMLQSNEVVLETRFFDDDGEPVSVTDYASRIGQTEPLFRGHTLDIYRDGRWSGSYQRRENAERIHPRRRSVYDVRQEYRLRSLNSAVLFVVRPSESRGSLRGRPNAGRGRLLQDKHDWTILAGRKPRSKQTFTYEIEYRREPGNPAESLVRDTAYRIALLDIDDKRLLRQLSEFLRDEVGLKPDAIPERDWSSRTDPFADERLKRAEKVVRHLRDSGRYSYTLDIPARRSYGDDAVIEFLRDTKTGHCEYYATALVLLLRADAIPARLVGGFRGGELNPLTDYFEVQQRHAHVWVEALIGNRWVTLDATPSFERATAVEEAGGFSHSWRNLKQFFNHFWATYIVEMNFSRQNDSMYRPLKTTASDAWNALSRERKGTAAGLQALKRFLSDPSRWMSWQGGLLSFGLMWLLVSIVWAFRRVWRLFRTIREDGLIALRNGRVVDFYERFREICESVGAVRSPTQTQREFAREFASRFEPQLAGVPLEYGPRELAAAFYSVRFGDKQISPGERRSIDEWLTKLEATLQNNESNGSNTSST